VHHAASVISGSEPPFAAAAHNINAKSNSERSHCGQTGLMHMQQLLMQHFLAFAESFVLRCGLCRGSGQ
jgi:hypothetical protein